MAISFGRWTGLVLAAGLALGVCGCLGEAAGGVSDDGNQLDAVGALSEEPDDNVDSTGGGGGEPGQPLDPTGLCANQSCQQI